MIMNQDERLMQIEVTGRVVYAHHDSEPVRTAVVVDVVDDDYDLGYDEYLVADEGRGEDLEDYVDDIVRVVGRIRILDSGEPLLYVTRFERW